MIRSVYALRVPSSGQGLVDSTNYDTATALAASAAAGTVALPSSGGICLEALLADNARLRARAEFAEHQAMERATPCPADRQNPTAAALANGGGTRQWMAGAGGVAGLADHTGQGYTRTQLKTRWTLGNRRFAHRPYEAVVTIMCELVQAPTAELRIFAAGTHVDIAQVLPLQARWEVIKTLR
jgi:hypothetical protein